MPAGRKIQPIYLRDGVYYARVNGKRWSTDTANMTEAMRRRMFMVTKNKPWSDLKYDYGNRVAIIIDTEGNTRAELVRHFSDPMEALHDMKAVEPPPDPGVNTNTSEPAKDCLDIAELLDYELSLKRASGTPENTITYYQQRYDALKRYARDFRLNLSNFSKKFAFEYANYRLTETVRGSRTLGFNNRKPSYPTINKEIKRWRNLWRTWKEEGRVPENPWARVPLMRPTGDDAEINEPYTFEEVVAILQNIDDLTIRALCIFQCMLGARPGEEILRISGKMVRAGKIYNAKKRRWDSFHYSDETQAFFFEYIEGKINDLTSDKVRQAFQKACEKAGVRVGTPYDLRHWFGTESLLENKLEVVQVMLRHKEMKTTQVYAKVRNAEAAQAQDKMQKKVLTAMTSV